jgi:threonine/homoserine/homoserine lactone efflux protein
LWLIAPVLLGKTLIELNHVFGWRKLADTCAVLIGVAWGAIAVAIALMVSLSSTYVELKDAVGYLTGLGAAVLLWMLHTTIHKGLVQMWRYGSEDDASARRFIEPA